MNDWKKARSVNCLIYSQWFQCKTFSLLSGTACMSLDAMLATSLLRGTSRTGRFLMISHYQQSGESQELTS